MTRPLELDPQQLYSLHQKPFLGTVHVRIEDGDGQIEYEGTFGQAVGEVLARALMLGRRKLDFPDEETIAVAALSRFFGWIRPIIDTLEDACLNSSLGSRYDSEVLRATYRQLGWSEDVGNAELPEPISLPKLVT